MLAAAALSVHCSSAPKLEKKGSAPDGRYVICLLPLSTPEGDVTEQTMAVTESVAASIGSDNEFFSVIPVSDFQKEFPEIRSGFQYEMMDYKRIRQAFNADMIVMGTIAAPNVRSGGNLETRAVQISLSRFSAHSGKSLLEGSLRLVTYKTGAGSTTISGPGWEIEIPPQSTRTVFERSKEIAEPFAYFLHGGIMQFQYWDRCAKENDGDSELLEIWEDGVRAHDGAEVDAAADAEAGSMIADEGSGASLPFFLHRPHKFETSGQVYPLLIYLHGTRASNDTLAGRMIPESPLSPATGAKDGKPWFDESKLKFLNNYLKNSFVLMPQAPSTPDYPGWDAKKLITLIAEIASRYPVDPRRIYITGISQGGFATWGYGSFLKGKIAAMAPVCGGGPTLGRNCAGNTPVWAFHAYDDRVVNFTLQAHAFEGLVRSRLGYGDADLFADYPFEQRKRILWPEYRAKRGMFCGYLCMDHKGAADNYTLSVSEGGQSFWTKGIAYPSGNATFALHAQGGHCPWPYGNPDFYRWMYSQKLERSP